MLKDRNSLDIPDIVTAALEKEMLTPEERELLDKWLEKEENQKEFHRLERLRSAIYAGNISKKVETTKAWNKFIANLPRQRKISGILRYAAIIILFFSIGGAFLLLKNNPSSRPVVAKSHIIIPGKKQAILTLSTGQQIALSNSLSPMTEKNGTTIQNTGNQLVYHPTDTTTLLVYNTVTVPRGGEYKLVLSDGSTVWINSESEIIYPVNFGKGERKVSVKGEAFFDIQKDTLRPFIVKTDQFNVRVTGTQFNIRTYPDDIASATLTHGGIELEKNNKVTRLIPGQQASLVNGNVEVKEVDTEEAVSWRYEAFCFKDRPLESILNEIARWYDIEIFYQNSEARAYHFTAWFRRSSSICEIINILEKTKKVKLELKGKTLTVKTN